MLNWRPENAEMYEDVQTRYTYAHSNLNKPEHVRLQKMWRSSRDSARTPVQWTDGPNAGFTTAEKPWFYVNPNYTEINVAQQEADSDSVLNFYKKAIALRKKLSCVRHGSYRQYRPYSGKHYIYSRDDGQQKILVVCSFSKKDTTFRAPAGFDISKAKLALCSVENPVSNRLSPYECRVYLW